MGIWNRELECLGREERVQRQWEHLQMTLNRAFRNVPFYRNRFQQREIDPHQVAGFDDLGRLPFTERHHFSDQYPYGLFAVPLRDIIRIHTAPGTAKSPTVSGYTQGDLHLWREMVARALSACGVGPDDIIQIILDPGLANWGRDYKDGAEHIGASVIPLNSLHLKKQLMVLRDYKTSVLITTPCSAYELLEMMFKTSLNPNELVLKTLVLVGEPADSGLRRELEEQLHVVTWSHYGLSEIPGPAVAFECRQHRGLHVNEDHFWVEVLDEENGGRASAQGIGELVLTTLTTRAFPLIRFRTGDRVRIIEEACACGRSLKRIRWYPERCDDLLTLHGVKLHRRQIMSHVEQVLGREPRRWHVTLTGKSHARRLEVWIGMDELLFSDEIKELERIVAELENEFLQELGIPVSVKLKETWEDQD